MSAFAGSATLRTWRFLAEHLRLGGPPRARMQLRKLARPNATRFIGLIGLLAASVGLLTPPP